MVPAGEKSGKLGRRALIGQETGAPVVALYMSSLISSDTKRFWARDVNGRPKSSIKAKNWREIDRFISIGFSGRLSDESLPKKSAREKGYSSAAGRESSQVPISAYTSTVCRVFI
jgi:hypothetical protein